jgi:hypothetical protein
MGSPFYVSKHVGLLRWIKTRFGDEEVACGGSLRIVMSFGCLLPITNTDAQKGITSASANDHGRYATTCYLFQRFICLHLDGVGLDDYCTVTHRSRDTC